jgi:S-DNA-T family DNA segregation ATPase FtsK/SpoIIIE
MNVRLFSPRDPVARAAEIPVGSSLLERGREASALILLAISVYLSLALGSLQVPGSEVSGADNWAGSVGEGIGLLLARGFGVLAWAVPLELTQLVWPLLKRRRIDPTGLRLPGNILVTIILCALVRIAWPEGVAFGGLPASGNVGLLFGELFASLFSTVGSFLVGGTAVGLILIGRASFSFIEWCTRVLHWASWARRRGEYWLRRALDALVQRVARRFGKGSPSVAFDAVQGASQFAAGSSADALYWQPEERTGPPPPALGARLRRAYRELNAEVAAPEAPTPKAAATETLDTEAAELGAETPVSKPRRARKKPTPAPEVQVDDDDDRMEVSDEADAADDAEPASEEIEQPPKRSVSQVIAEKRGPSEAAKVEPLKIVDTSQNIEVERAPVVRDVVVRSDAGFVLPGTEFLEPASTSVVPIDAQRVHELAARLEKTLADYGVSGKVEEVHPGPTVTTYEVTPEAGTKVSKVASLADDLALGLSRKVRIIAPIPGKARIGFEIPNDERVPVNLRELIEDVRFKKLAERVPLPVVLGRDIVGAPFYADLSAMPHVIVAGATGAGKSVGLNVMLSSLLFKRSPDELRMLMIDPKVVELAPFDGIPHMLLPVVTDMKQAAKALKWAVDEMERRYLAFAAAGTKNISTYNRWAERVQAGELPAPAVTEVTAIGAGGAPVSVPAAKSGSDGALLPGKMPHIVIVVDEFADLIMQQGKDVESAVARLAQKARAAGMHVVLATQRPSVDVITGMIKANFPTRIAFRVTQKVDSRTILDEMGAELLLGKGDMLVKLNGASETSRVQCPFVSEEEVNALTDYLRKQGTPVYHDDILKGGDDEEGAEANAEELDPRFDEAVRIVAETQRCSTSWLQRKMTIGYNRAAKIVESMEVRGIVGPANGAKDREIFVQPH